MTPLLLALILACGGGPAISSPCDLADAAMVESALGGTASEGVEGDLLNCDFDIDGGVALEASVFDFGEADDWEATRQGFVDNRGGVTEVADVGDAAFYPNDASSSELVVQAGGRIFSVTIFTGLEEPSTSAVNGLSVLAKAIADRLTA